MIIKQLYNSRYTNIYFKVGILSKGNLSVRRTIKIIVLLKINIDSLFIFHLSFKLLTFDVQ